MKTIMYLLLVAAICGCRSVKTNRDKSASDIVHSAYVSEKDYSAVISDSAASVVKAVQQADDLVIEFNDTTTTDVPVRIEQKGGTITIHAPQRNIKRIKARVQRDSVITSTVATQAQQLQQVQRDNVVYDSAHVVKDVKVKESKGLPLTGFMVFVLLFAMIAAVIYWNGKELKA